MKTEENGNILEHLNSLVSEAEFIINKTLGNTIELELPNNIEDILRYANNDLEGCWSIYCGCVPPEYSAQLPAIKSAFLRELADYLSFS